MGRARREIPDGGGELGPRARGARQPSQVPPAALPLVEQLGGSVVAGFAEQEPLLDLAHVSLKHHGPCVHAHSRVFQDLDDGAGVVEPLAEDAG